MPVQVTFESKSSCSFVPVAVELIGRFCGLQLVGPPAGDRSQPVDVYYGPDADRPCRLRIPYVEAYDERSVPALPDLSASRPVAPAAPFPFDLFSAMRFWLADEGNAKAERGRDLDRRERLLGDRSAQSRKGCREVPIVNAYLVLFTRWVEERFGVRLPGPLPPGKRCAVILSHDADDPLDPTPRKFLWLAARNLPYHPLRAARCLSWWMVSAAKRLRGGPRDRHWLFEDILREEDRFGFRSTFFFSVVPAFARGASRLDVLYDVHQKQFAPMFRRLSAGGWEIGLHASYHARRGYQRIAHQRRVLEQAAGVPVVGNRHHCWHTGWPFWATLEAHGRAGLEYDSSVAFNETPGYRLGIALSCHLWNPLSGTRIPTLQIPCAVMDGAYFYRPHQTVEATLDHFDGLVQGLKRWFGSAAICWHVRTSYPASQRFEVWGRAYLEILRVLASDQEVLVQSCGQASAAQRPA